MSSFPAPVETMASNTCFNAGYSSNALKSESMNKRRFSESTLVPNCLMIFLSDSCNFIIPNSPLSEKHRAHGMPCHAAKAASPLTRILAPECIPHRRGGDNSGRRLSSLAPVSSLSGTGIVKQCRQLLPPPCPCRSCPFLQDFRGGKPRLASSQHAAGKGGRARQSCNSAARPGKPGSVSGGRAGACSLPAVHGPRFPVTGFSGKGCPSRVSAARHCSRAPRP